MAEQFIGQHLLYLNGSGKRPGWYWLRRTEERAEVDFVSQPGKL